MITLLIFILAAFVSADVISFNIEKDKIYSHGDAIYRVISLINPGDETSLMMDSLMDGAESHY